MAKLNKANDGRLIFYCSGCESYHFADQRWTFNGDYERPTFDPSVLVTIGHDPDPPDICHFYVRDGRIQYLTDCTHPLAGQTIDMVECDW
jgi:hypothetical protein